MPPPKPTIVPKLAGALHRLLQQELSGPCYREDRVAAGLLRILSAQPFREDLLFRDFDRGEAWLRPAAADGPDDTADTEDDTEAADRPRAAQPARVYEPALVYVTLVLSRRLTLANNRKEHPTNMHVLLAALAAHGPAADGWPRAAVYRAPACPREGHPPPSFPPVARILAAQVARLGTGYGPISAGARGEYGPLWLALPDDATEVAEELTLWNCLAAVPVPLARALDQAALARLVRVLESLNERYAALRACGLDPEQWYDDPELSIQALGQLDRLRQAARARLAAAGGLDAETAYARAFAEQQGEARTLGGFQSFADFAASAVGQALMHRGPRSLSEPLGEAEDARTLGEALSGDDPHPAPPGLDALPTALKAEVLAYAIAHCPGIAANPVLAWFARAALLEGRRIHGPGGILADPAFRALLEGSARYPAADGRITPVWAEVSDANQALLTALERDLSEAMRACRRRFERTDRTQENAP